ncbi:MAG: YfhO family protein [Weeksellaceae bacterium]|nr:YfhO family protein [Weeksellaceae bacterium]
MKNKNLVFSILSLLLMAILALIYCSPVLSGDSILQPDIVNYRGSAEEMKIFEAQTGENIYWSNAMFGGMPTYQTGAAYDYDMVKSIDHFFRFLPRPADYIFLLFAGFFILGMVVFKNWKYALTGSIFFALGAYYFIIIGAGHNSKVHAIAYFAPLVAGILLLYQKKYILGFLMTALFMGLELSANHPQMSYYLFLVMLVFFVIELFSAFKSKEIKPFLISTGLLVGACLIGVGMNSGRLLSTIEYSKETTRGKTEMSLMQENTKGLNHEYITHWSYGKLETFNLFIPNFMGGSSQSDEDQLKNYIAELQKQQFVVDLTDDFNAQLFEYIVSSPASTYWGEQPGTSGPAYQGAVVVFLFFLGLFLVKNKWSKYKWWLLAATLLSIVLAWGKNFAFLTDFMIDYFPFYNKFRAVSSMLVMAEFTMPLLAALCLFVFVKDAELSDEFKKKILFYAGGGVLALLILFYLLGGSLFSFTTEYDQLSQQQIMQFIRENNQQAYGIWDTVLNNINNALRQDRIALFKADTLRTMIFVMLTWGLLFLHLNKKIKNSLVLVLGIAALAFIDGWQVDKRYLNENNFVDKMFVENPFPTQLSTKLQQGAAENYSLAGIAYKVPFNNTLDSLRKADPSVYRVFDNVFSPFNDATVSYFAHSVGGYHGAKLRNYQDIIDLYFSGSEHANQLGISPANKESILNLLNTKYLIQGSPRSPMVELNDNAYGNVWMATDIKWADNTNDEILALKDVDLSKTVVLNSQLKDQVETSQEAALSVIGLKEYRPDRLTYQADVRSPGLAVFSEIYYPHGWTVSVDGEERPLLKANYFLRAVQLKKGDKQVVMEFKPQIIQTAKSMTLTFNVIFVLLIIGGGFKLLKRLRNN